MKKISLLFSVMFMAIFSYSQMFIEVPEFGSPGTTGVPILSYQFGAGIGVGSAAGGSRETSAPSYSEITLTKNKSAYSLKLLKALSSPTLFNEMRIKLYDAKGTKVVYQITLYKVYVSGFSQGVGCGTKDCDGLAESISLNYAKIKIQDLENNTSIEYDLAQQKVL